MIILPEWILIQVGNELTVLVKARWDHCKTANLRHTFPEKGLIFVTFHPAIDTIAPNWWNFSKDPNEFLAAREKIAQQILNLKKADGY